MNFANSSAINLFWIAAMLLLFYLWRQKKRRLALASFADKQLLSYLLSSFNAKARAAKILLTFAALVLLVFSLMRPQWGFKWQEVKQRGIDILVAIDTSKSMLACDVKPNRLERAKLAVKDLVAKLNGDRVGLIAFAGTAFLQCPLTVDYYGFLLALDDLTSDTIPKGGTSLAASIEEAVRSYKAAEGKGKVLVIITDGEDHEGNALAMAAQAKKNGIKVFCVGVGTREGELIQVSDGAGGKDFLKDNSGNVVKSRLDEELLQKIALATDAAYVRASGADFGLDYLYSHYFSKIEKKEFSNKMIKRFYERFQIPLVLVFLLLFIEPFISERKNG